jgi:hypothetical protein
MPMMAESPDRRGGESLDILQDEEGEDGDDLTGRLVPPGTDPCACR